MGGSGGVTGPDITEIDLPDPGAVSTPEPITVAVYTGKPGEGQRCGNNPGSGYGYDDNLNYMREGVPAQVKNINEVVQGKGFPYGAGGKLMIYDTVLGWIYQDQWGYYYFQANPNLSWVPSVSVSYTFPGGFGVGFAVSAVPNTSAQQLMYKGAPATGQPVAPSGKEFVQCWDSLPKL